MAPSKWRDPQGTISRAGRITVVLIKGLSAVGGVLSER